ncbi:hypothetical protein FOPG_06646 [Fusarium oxysporum f. sp. conglutinans race 2 54008]|uniref:Uncharacterized protein n=1 Tax=Fusarium oxysporum f. sp. conglutinans race 2 54008 TaxID=1089457 RepID=X0I5H8_FUSOX|nr:hypothetical protein FOPG_06646 [Fusarium oxysporum f. sp. conglutinans race 2 54008]
MMIENTPSLLSRENLKQDQVSREPQYSHVLNT